MKWIAHSMEDRVQMGPAVFSSLSLLNFRTAQANMIHLCWTPLMIWIQCSWKKHNTITKAQPINCPLLSEINCLKPYQLSALRMFQKPLLIKKEIIVFPGQAASHTQGPLKGLPERETTFPRVLCKIGREGPGAPRPLLWWKGSDILIYPNTYLLSWNSTGLFTELDSEENRYITVKTSEEFGNIKYSLRLAGH